MCAGSENPMRPTILAVVITVAIVEGIFLGILLVGAFSSDPLGTKIARGVLTLLGIPFLLFTVPAVVMALGHRSPTATLAMAVLGLVAMWLLWLGA